MSLHYLAKTVANGVDSTLLSTSSHEMLTWYGGVIDERALEERVTGSSQDSSARRLTTYIISKKLATAFIDEVDVPKSLVNRLTS